MEKNIFKDEQEYILCAAIKRIEPRPCMPYHEGTNDICYIEIGYRHHDILQRFYGEVSKKIDDQGFYTSKGRFVDRYDAAIIALKAGQISEEDKVVSYSGSGEIDFITNLYSEDLY